LGGTPGPTDFVEQNLSRPVPKTSFAKTRETELLLACAASHLDAARIERIKTLARGGEIDWAQVLQTALQHRVMPVLYRSLYSACADAVPTALLKQLKEYFDANAGHNALLTMELFALLDLLEAHGIPAIPYKGPVLAAAVYGDLTLRQFDDLDILVRPQDAQQATAVLLSRGYRRWENRPATMFHRFRKVEELIRADGQVLLELHQVITSGTFFFPLHPDRLWARVAEVSLPSTNVRSLPPEELLAILCVHGAKHHWSRLGWICDVAELLRAYPSLDWEGLLGQSRRLGGTRMLLLGLQLVQLLLGADLPVTVWQRIQADRVVPWLTVQVCTQLFAATRRPLAAIDRPRFYLRVRERVRDKARCVFYLAYHTMMPEKAQAWALRLLKLRR
jgi:Uncharacterised nucleotidyltransferase